MAQCLPESFRGPKGTCRSSTPAHPPLRWSDSFCLRTSANCPADGIGKDQVVREPLSIDHYLETSKELWAWVATRLDGHTIPELPYNKRLQLALACQHLAIEHAQSIICLIDHELHGSAMALQRPMFEAVIRGVWLRYSATERQVDRAAEGKFPRSDDMVGSSPSSKDQKDAPPLRALKDDWWKRFCGYTHGGTEQILARLGSSGLRTSLQCGEVIAALRWSDMIQLYSGTEMLVAARDDALAKEFLRRMKSHGETSGP